MQITRLILLLFAISLLSSCVRYRDLLIFNEGPPFPQGVEKVEADFQLKVQPDDILYISVHTLEEELSKPFNLLQGGNVANLGGNVAQNPLIGYLVDPSGYIDFPGIGPLKVGGLTLEGVKQLVLQQLAPYLKSPVVRVRFLNFRVSVLGEVRSPGVLNFTQQRVTILEALGLAGDITDLGRRDNILVIRETNGQREYGRVNLHDRNLFKSPYFYLKQNDIVYAEPAKARILTVADPTRRIAPWVGLVSSVLTLALVLTR
ncbi:MAG: hypothetical protein D6714_10880 [Bacteroidetes bacterium]|nr:MAG: hypothetical protein D6714_10880 [Bacteroidota bacterium]